MKSLIKAIVVGGAVAVAIAMVPSSSFAGEWHGGGHSDNGWSVLGHVLTAPLFVAANVIDHTVPRVSVGVAGPGAYCAPISYGCAPARYGYYPPAVVVRPDVRYCAPAPCYGYRGHYGYCR